MSLNVVSNARRTLPNSSFNLTAFLALRAYALTRGNRALAILVFLMHESFVGPNIVSVLPVTEDNSIVRLSDIQYELSQLHGQIIPDFVGCQSILSRTANPETLATR